MKQILSTAAAVLIGLLAYTYIMESVERRRAPKVDAAWQEVFEMENAATAVLKLIKTERRKAAAPPTLAVNRHAADGCPPTDPRSDDGDDDAYFKYLRRAYRCLALGSAMYEPELKAMFMASRFGRVELSHQTLGASRYASLTSSLLKWPPSTVP